MNGKLIGATTIEYIDKKTIKKSAKRSIIPLDTGYFFFKLQFISNRKYVLTYSSILELLEKQMSGNSFLSSVTLVIVLLIINKSLPKPMIPPYAFHIFNWQIPCLWQEKVDKHSHDCNPCPKEEENP